MIRRNIQRDERASLYLEFLFALSLWLVILSSFLPVFLQITADRMELFIDHEAQVHLSEQMIYYVLNESVETEIAGKYVDYTVTVEKIDQSVFLCLHYSIKDREEKRVCRTIEK
ncbi:hypothetical protein [Fervidibacillus albus]|uniref:Competence protein ComG n=1 Tax=Fervidibacillus albus TaxID=2980026 RepID=A0A9E8LX71_9BACI|nr:hypothetical protein [Fervidibacillus albus]WAA10434.1 hypothetical protein OE104_03635 [Fervidibacillus albus]